MAQSLKGSPGRSLASLPLPFLSLLLSSPSSSYLTIPLWNCGNTALNRLLAISVTSLDLKDTNRFSTSRWPSIVSHLSSLRSLRISRPNGFLLPHNKALLAEIRKLPASVERISILSAEFLLDLFLPSNTLLSDVISSKLLSQDDLNKLNAIFANPHARQHEESQSIHISTPCILTPEIIASLPKNLTRLTGNFQLEGVHGDWKEEKEGTTTSSPAPLPWPPSLSHLESTPYYISTKQWHLLPPSLTSLVSHGIPSENTLLPPSLTHLELFNPASVLKVLPSTLPSTLTSMKTGYVNRQIFQRLSMSLRSLSILLRRRDFVDEPLDLANCSLTSLSINFWECKRTNKLPSQLTSFTVHHLSTSDEDPSSTFAHPNFIFPQGLTSLKIGGGKCDLNPASCDFRSLPRLKHLSIDGKMTFHSPILKRLPHGLLSLEIRLKSIKKRDAPFLPQNATLLNFSGLKKLKHTSVLKHWPLQADLPSLWRSKKVLKLWEKRLVEATERSKICPDARISSCRFKHYC